MKKFLIGCGVVAAIVFAILCGAGYWASLKFREVKAGMDKISSQYRDIDAEFKFDKPSNDLLTDDQVTRWLAVRKELVAEVKSFQSDLDAKGGKANGPLKFIKLMSDHTKTFVDVHIAALRAQKMSANEYDWTTRHVLGSINSRLASNVPELKEVAHEFEAANSKTKSGNQGSQQTMDRFSARMTDEETIANLAILKDHAEDLKATMDVLPADVILLPAIEGMRGPTTQTQQQGSAPRPAGTFVQA